MRASRLFTDIHFLKCDQTASRVNQTGFMIDYKKTRSSCKISFPTLHVIRVSYTGNGRVAVISLLARL